MSKPVTTQKTTSRRAKTVKAPPKVSEAVKAPQPSSEGKNEGMGDAIASLTLTTPPPIALNLEPGDSITTSSGNAIVTAIEPVGNAQIIHARYGDGVAQPHRPEAIEINDSVSFISEVETEAIAVEVLPTDAEIEALYQELIAADEQAQKILQSASEKYYQLGEVLSQVRNGFKRGTWKDWLSQRGIHEKYAERSMQIFRKFQGRADKLSFFSVSQALEQARLPQIEEYSFPEVAALYAELPNARFVPQKNGSFRYAIEIPGKNWLMRSTDEAFSYFPQVKKWIEAAKGATTCDRCQHCEELNENWYCKKHQQAYDREENPAPNCEQYLPLILGHLTREGVEQERSLPLALNTLPVQPQVNPAPLVEAAIVEASPAIAPIPPIEVHEQDKAADPAQTAAEQFICQFGVGLSMEAIALKILIWCGEGELKAIEKWMQQRRLAA